jgi:hypothetical protein
VTQRASRAAIIAVIAFGCGDTVVDRDVCGNGLIEPGEDCDSTDPRCSECGIVCTETADCLAYDETGGTAGFVCGPDSFCHAPAGSFERAGEAAMPVTSYRITDVNADGFGDVLGQSQSAVTVLFGDADAGLFTSADIQTPFPQGRATYADLDGDGSLDVVAPTADGIVAYTTPFGVPSPYPFPSFVGEAMGKPLFVEPIADSPTANHLGIIGTIPETNGLLAYLALDVQGRPPTSLGQAVLCGGSESEFSADDVDVFSLGPGRQLVAVTLRPAGQAPRLCLLTIEPDGDVYKIAPIAFTPTAVPTARAVLANLRGQACPSLLLEQGGLVEYAPASATPPCSFASTPQALAGAPQGAAPVGSAPLVPAIAGLGGVAIALTTGIYGFAPGVGLVELYRSDRALGAIRFADLERDGDLDIIASGQRIDDIDLIERRGNSYAFAFRFQTDALIVTFVLGDYDGNEFPDVAYVERGVNEERLVIAYGTSDQLSPGVTVGTFAKVLSVIPSNIPDSIDKTNVISDLAVLFDVGIGSQLSLLHGSPQRTMLAYFDPRQQPASPDSMFRGVAVGNFGGDGFGNDLLAVEDIGVTTNLYMSRGAMSGELEMGTLPSTSSSIGNCDGAGDPLLEPFCIVNAHYTRWPVDAQHDLAVGVDVKNELLIFDPLQLQPNSEPPLMRFADKLIAPANTVVQSLQPITFSDGSRRLLVSFGPSADAAVPRLVSAVNICTIDDAQPVPACTDLGETVSAAVGEPTICVDAGIARVAPASRFHPPDSDGEDLVVLCRRPVIGDTLFRVSLDGTTVVPLLELGGADAMQIGDVTGDGIADVVVIDRNFAVPVMRVFRQCTSRDVGCGGLLGAE